MTNPSVCAILLTADRPAMARRAVESFRAQTYENKRLLIYDTNLPVQRPVDCPAWMYLCCPSDRDMTIGRLRNAANANAVGWRVRHLTEKNFTAHDIFIHWDDDDISNPNRIAEQVELLQSSGADVCGYNECLFWREPEVDDVGKVFTFTPGEAWIYRDHRPDRAIGSSLCYARSFWENHPFADGPKPGVSSEYYSFLRAGKTVAVSSIKDGEPRLICSIHSSNHNLANYNQMFTAAKEGRTNSWVRSPQFDDICRERMAL